MKKTSESGRSMVEILAVLAIMAVLTIASIAGFNHMMTKQKINDIINTVNLGSIQALTALQTRSFQSADELNDFLKQFATSVSGYNVTFKAPADEEPFEGKEFVAEITDRNGIRIKGRMCRLLLTEMVRINGVSDIDFTVKQEEMEDGSFQDVTMRLSGKAVDLNALCGKDVF